MGGKGKRRKNMEIGILNCAICTDVGEYSFKKSSLEEVKKLLKESNFNFISAIGHQSTAEVLSELLDVNIPVNRIKFKQKLGQTAIVFKLLDRIPEGKILSKEEIEAIGYEFCLLIKKS